MGNWSKLKVIYEDNHLIAVDKPIGYLVHGDGSDAPVLSDLVKSYIKERYNKPGDVFLGVIHRLDQVVSGVVIYARTSKALERMNELIKQRQVEKIYWAITEGLPPENEDTLRHFIWKDKELNKVKAWEVPPKKYIQEAKEAILHYKLIMNFAGNNLLEIKLETGRPHQIRAQLAAIGCPIKFDVKYGYKQAHPDRLISLHCHKMSFVHPVKKERISIKCYPAKRNGWDLFDYAAF